MLFLLKVTCLHLNNILSASILVLLENNLLNLTTPWVTGRNMNPHSLGMCLLVLEQTLSSHPYFSSSSITIYITWFPRTPPPTHTHTHTLWQKASLVQGVTAGVKPHCNVQDLQKWRVGRCQHPVPPDQFLPWTWTYEWLPRLNEPWRGRDSQSFPTPVSSILLLTGPLYYSGTQVGLQPPTRPGPQSSGYTGSSPGIVFSRVYSPLPAYFGPGYRAGFCPESHTTVWFVVSLILQIHGSPIPFALPPPVRVLFWSLMQQVCILFFLSCSFPPSSTGAAFYPQPPGWVLLPVADAWVLVTSLNPPSSRSSLLFKATGRDLWAVLAWLIIPCLSVLAPLHVTTFLQSFGHHYLLQKPCSLDGINFRVNLTLGAVPLTCLMGEFHDWVIELEA